MLSEHPIILTLKINDDAAAYFNGLRKQHFPTERNYLDAHFTLFHHLPGNEDQLLMDPKTITGQQKQFDLQVTQVVSIGAGVAFKIESDVIKSMHKKMQQQWQTWLTPQDKQALWPHITIQNKVDRDIAVQLQQELSAGFELFKIQALGLQVWEYLGGSWNLLETLDFEQ